MMDDGMPTPALDSLMLMMPQIQFLCVLFVVLPFFLKLA
jgi:hypothetical protein